MQSLRRTRCSSFSRLDQGRSRTSSKATTIQAVLTGLGAVIQGWQWNVQPERAWPLTNCFAAWSESQCSVGAKRP